jgi:hypothetical protein
VLRLERQPSADAALNGALVKGGGNCHIVYCQAQITGDVSFRFGFTPDFLVGYQFA